jgi:hypothetical protein
MAFGWALKISQGYIIHKDFGFMKDHVMMPWLQTTHYHNQPFFMSWPFQLGLR